MYHYKHVLKSAGLNSAPAFRAVSANRLMSRNSKFVYQVLKDSTVIGGGPLTGSLSEAQQALEQLISNGELSQIYWTGITSVIMLDKDQNKITSYSLSK